jgi:hypothetical protein
MFAKYAEFTVPLVCAVFMIGCAPGESTSSIDLRKTILLSEEPAQVSSVAEAKEGSDWPRELTVRGRIDLAPFKAVADRKAIFMLNEIIANGHSDDPSHDASNCPFCKKKSAQAPKAAVRLVDNEGVPLSIGVERLLGVQQDDIVIVQGQGDFSAELDLLTITAHAVFVAEN